MRYQTRQVRGWTGRRRGLGGSEVRTENPRVGGSIPPWAPTPVGVIEDRRRPVCRLYWSSDVRCVSPAPALPRWLLATITHSRPQGPPRVAADLIEVGDT